jgi:hypothetical protein
LIHEQTRPFSGQTRSLSCHAQILTRTAAGDHIDDRNLVTVDLRDISIVFQYVPSWLTSVMCAPSACPPGWADLFGLLSTNVLIRVIKKRLHRYLEILCDPQLDLITRDSFVAFIHSQGGLRDIKVMCSLIQGQLSVRS